MFGISRIWSCLAKALAERLAHHDILCDRHVTSSQPFCCCLMARLVALFKKFHLRLHPPIRGAIITIDIGESCAWPYTGIMDLHSISFLSAMSILPPHFCEIFSGDSRCVPGMQRFYIKTKKSAACSGGALQLIYLSSGPSSSMSNSKLFAAVRAGGSAFVEHFLVDGDCVTSPQVGHLTS